ncbi:hypothetical protein JXQ70_11525 [bacterium]|nr:hypothetical protein [bacterium]
MKFLHRNIGESTLIALFSVVVTIMVFEFSVPPERMYTLENVFFLSLVLCGIVALVRVQPKNRLDHILLIALIGQYFQAPLKYYFFDYLVYYSINLVQYTLLLIFIWAFLKKFVSVPKWLMIMGVGFQFVYFLPGIVFLNTVTAEYYFIRLGDFGLIDMDLVVHFGYKLILSLSALVPVIYIVGSVFLNGRHFTGIKSRHVLALLAVFFYFLNSLLNTVFVSEGLRSPWLHGLLELLSICVLLILFIAIRLSSRPDQAETRQMLIGIQFSLIVPLVYVSLRQGDQRSLVATICILLYVELLFLLFYTLLTVRTRLVAQGNMLAEMASYLRSLWNKAGDELFITDDQGEIISTGAGLDRMQSLDVQGCNIQDIIHFSGADHARVASIPVQAGSTRGTDAKGVHMPPALFHKQFDTNLGPLYVNIIRDDHKYQAINQLHQDMQNKLLELKKSESLLNFSGDIAHNMNNFLSGIRGYCELIRIEAEKPDLVLKYLEKIMTEITRIAAYIQKISDLTRPTPHDLQPVDLTLICRQAITQIIQRLDHTRISFNCHLSESIFGVSGIHDDLVDVFQHLFWNSIEAMPQGGTITVSSNRISTSDNAFDSNQQEYVSIHISDTGTGIAPEHKDFIFDPFFSTNASVGKGLGLSVVMAIVNCHRGTVSFRNNQSGPGTTFTVTLPALYRKSQSVLQNKLLQYD